jgi:3-methyladenine DNA glycosylase AlkD
VASTSAEDLDQALRRHADPARAVKEKAYLKSDVTHYGVPVPTMHRLAAAATKGLNRETLTALARGLWDEPVDSPVFERRFLAADLLAHRAELLSPADLTLLERMCREARTWAIIDTLAPRVVGPMTERFDREVRAALDRWVDDPDVWMRRVVLLAHLVPLRDGRGDWARFTGYADHLLADREFFVAKALGWVLRDTGRRRPEMVLEWVEPRITRMQPVTAREAIKPFSVDVQARLRAARAVAG